MDRMIMGNDKFVEWAQKKFIDRTEKGDAELPQKKRIGDEGVVKKVTEEIIRNYKIKKYIKKVYRVKE